MQLDALSPSFRGEEGHLEEGYLTTFFRKNLQHFRFSMGAGMFFVGTWAFIDVTFYPEQLTPFITIKLVVMLAFAVGLLFSLTPLALLGSL